MVGFVEPLIEVDESDERATLNVSISFPAPDPLLQFEIVFTLLANTVDGSAGTGDAHQCLNHFPYFILFHIQDQDQLQLPGVILSLGLRTIMQPRSYPWD